MPGVAPVYPCNATSTTTSTTRTGPLTHEMPWWAGDESGTGASDGASLPLPSTSQVAPASTAPSSSAATTRRAQVA